MIGMLLGFFKNMLFIGYALVESLVFMIVFNAIAPTLIEWGIPIPTDNVKWMFMWAFFILIHFVGGFIGKLTPKFVEVNQSQKNED